MAITINAKTSGAGGLETTADNTGNINIQSGGSTVMSVTSSGVAITGALSQNGGAYSTQPTFRNRIINGDMRIHQRGGTITAASATVYYGLDRFWGFAGTGQFSMEQSTDAPDNFLNSMKVTVTTVDSSMAASDRYMLSQPIEGLNVTDLDFGSATAKTVTLSFWVKSSITGTFGVVLINGNATRTYVKEYTINSANTWEKKTITIAGDTTGTWTYTNALWGSVRFCLATGSTYQGTDSTWNAGNYISTSNQTNLMATSGATFYITGVQLEVGSTATDFEVLPYDVQLARCERYFQKIDGGFGVATASTNVQINVVMRVPMRATPSAAVTTLRITDMTTADHQATSATISLPNITPTMSRTNCGGFTGLTTSRAYTLLGSSTSAAPILFSAEL